MAQLHELLKNPFDGVMPDDNTGIQNRCSEIAKTLVENYCIKCGDKTFCFGEIEFYYYKKEKPGGNNYDKDWNRETYPRNKNAGEFFFHYSGVDICFQCHFEEEAKDNDFGEFGGILIRSLRDGNNILAGPLFCTNAMLNACKGSLPVLEKTDCQRCDFSLTTRCGISSDKSLELSLCYYVTHVNGKSLEKEWGKASDSLTWDKNKGMFKPKTRNYKKERHFYEDK